MKKVFPLGVRPEKLLEELCCFLDLRNLSFRHKMSINCYFTEVRNPVRCNLHWLIFEA